MNTFEVTSIQDENFIEIFMEIASNWYTYIIFIFREVFDIYSGVWILKWILSFSSCISTALIFVWIYVYLIFFFRFFSISFHFILFFSEDEIMHIFNMTFIYFRIVVNVTCQCDESAERITVFSLCFLKHSIYSYFMAVSAAPLHFERKMNLYTLFFSHIIHKNSELFLSLDITESMWGVETNFEIDEFVCDLGFY